MKIGIKILSISVLSLIVSCGGNNKENEHEHEHEVKNDVELNLNQQKALSLKLGHFEMRNITNVIKINGELKISPENTAEVTAIVGGNVKSINVFNGDKVKKGQKLAVLEHPDYIKIQEDFAQIANNLGYLQNEYERQKQLFENNVASGKEFQKAKTEYFNTKSKYQGLKSRLIMLNLFPNEVKNGNISGTINILSPINGFVSDIAIKLGTYVNSKDKMFEISDNTKIHADFKIFEKDLPYLKEGSSIHFVVSNLPEKEYTAKVFAIEKKFDNENQSITIHSEIQGDKSNLMPGMFITGHLHSNNKFVKTLPKDAIVKDGEKYFIFIVDNHNNEHNHHETKHHEVEEYNHIVEHNLEEDLHKYETNNIEEIRLIPVEVVPGITENNYIEIKLMQKIPDNSIIALNSAYYLFSEMKKSEMEHHH